MYNTKKYVKQAVDSVLNQSFQDCEVIIVDDCSTDGSYEFCQSLYGKNERVHIIHREKNGGVALARNSGLREATGKYVALLDSDDVILPDALEILYESAEMNNADIVTTSAFLRSKEEEIGEISQNTTTLEFIGKPTKNVTLFQYPPPMSPDYFQKRLDDYLNNIYGFCIVWNKLYLRKFLMHNNLFLDPYAEDRLFTFRCMLYVQRYVKIPNIINVYRNIPVSVSRQPASAEHLQRMVRGLNGFAMEFNNYMKDIEFFNQHPEYRFAVLERQLLEVDNYETMRYYPDTQGVNIGVIKLVEQEMEKIFGENSPMVEWLFHRYHLLSRRIT